MQKVDAMPNFRVVPILDGGTTKFKIQKRISFLFVSFWVDRGADNTPMSFPIICETVKDAEEKIEHLSKSIYYVKN